MKKILLIVLLLFVTSVCYAETWEMAICSVDEADLASGHKRMKKGDIIAVVPYPWTWGTEEVKIYTIIIVNNLTEEEASVLQSPYYEGGVTTLPPFTEPQPAIIGKRLHNVDFSLLKTNVDATLNLTTLENKESVYQPFKDQNIQINANVPASFDAVIDKYDALQTIEGAKKL